MPDGGRSAAWGFFFQYVRTLEALLDVVDLGSARAVYVEGKGANARGRPAESVDYELVDHAGVTVAAVQVKGRGPDGCLGPAAVFRALSGLARDRNALRYELITNARLGKLAVVLAEILQSGAGPGELRWRISEVLSAAGADHAKAELLRLGEEELTRLGRGLVIIDPREDAEVHAALRTRLRRYRNDHRKGLGDASAGLMAGYLLSEIFAGAAYEGRAEITVAAFRSWLLADSATLRAAVSRRDWGIVVGSVPGWPDIYRGDLIEQITGALPCRGEETAVRRCLLAGLSGIGKSSLAASFIMDRADLYDVIYWVDGESDAALAGSFARVAAHLAGTGGDDVADAARLRDHAHDALARSAGRWLMVLDNCADLRAAEPWIPRAGNGHVIVTATDDAAPPGSAAKITVGPMSEAEAITLVRARLSAAAEISSQDVALISRLVHAMERWPLALELAAAYITAGGMAAAGIPRYLATLKMRSLDHSRAVPPGYPRTLVEAIFLCLERIESQSEYDSDPAGVAASAMWFAAYLSSRRIPVHLLITAVMMDPQTAGGFQATTPCYMSPSVCPDPEVISLLRSESLVSLDEPLPPEGLTDSSVPDATVSVNSVLQEVLRYRRDADPRVPEHLLGRLAYHVALWLAASHGSADYPRTLIFAAHAAAIHEHAVRLGADSDYMALMRGNLAPVLLRRGDTGQAAALLRAEIAQVEVKPAEHCVVLNCQGQIMLAGVLAEDEPPGYAEIIRLLASAFVILQARAVDKPAGVARLALGIQRTLRRVITQAWGPDGKLMHDLSQLEAAVTDLLSRLPDTHVSAVLQVLEDAETAFRSDRPMIAAGWCREALDQIAQAPSEELMTQRLEPQARRLLVEALISSGNMADASHELGAFWAATEPAELHATMREQLLHNAGQALALKWLTSAEPAPALTELLASMVTPELTEPIEAVFPGRTAARIRLLRAVSALADHDEHSASAHFEIALPELQSDDGQSARSAGWLLVARLTQKALAEHRQMPGDQTRQPTPAGTQTTGSPPQTPEPEKHVASRDRASFPRYFQRRVAPELMAQGLPGPVGTWIRRPRPGEGHAISDLLDDADDELAPWIADAINNCTLSSALAGILTHRQPEELATELLRGGKKTFLAGLTIVLVAVTPNRKLIGAIQVSPPFRLLDELGDHGIVAAQQRAGAATIAKISGVAVAPPHRGTGIGRALISSALDLSWRLGRQLVYGQFQADPRLSRFFASCGFSICDPLTAIDLAPYGVPAVITPQPGNQFFATRFELISGQNEVYEDA
jgi:GNAT superfamily N-acetyltransferase